MTTLDFTPEELETLRVALLSAHYAADDEERALRARAADSPLQRALDEDGAIRAATRAHAYQILAERVMAAQKQVGLM